MDAETRALFEELLSITAGAIGRVRRKASDDDDVKVERLIAIGGAAVAALAAQLAAGTITRVEFVAQALTALGEHAHAAADIGAAAFDGDAESASIDDLIDGQTDYLDGFAGDIGDGGLSDAAIAARAALYGGVLWTALQLGRGDGAQAAGLTQCWWDLDPGAQHCATCPDLADGSPYAYPDELPTYPGQDVDCQSNCRCALRFEGEASDDEDKAMRPRIVAVAHCPLCGRWVGRGIPVGAECYCPEHKGVRIAG